MSRAGRKLARRFVAPALLALALLAPALAAAIWSAPVQLSAEGRDAAHPRVAIDDEGDAIFAWERPRGGDVRIQVRARSAAGVLGPVKAVSEPGFDAFNPQLASDADGDTVIVWERWDGMEGRVQAVRRAADGTLGPVQTLSAPGAAATFAQVAVDDDGDAVVAWSRSDGSHERIQARGISAAGALSPVRNLSAPGANAVFPAIASEPDGDTVIAWQRFDGSEPSCCTRIQARARTAAGALSPVRTLSIAERNAINAQVAVDDDGDSVVTWRRYDESEAFCCDRIQARARAGDGTLGPVRNLSAAGLNGSEARVGVDADGDALLAWRVFDESAAGCCNRIQARPLSAAGDLGPVRNLSAAGQSAAEPDVAVEPDGDAIVIWRRSNGSHNLAQARTRSAAGVLGPTETLSLPGQHAGEPQVALSPLGLAAAGWRRSDGTDDRVEAAFGP